MHDPEEIAKVRDGMRKYLLDIAADNPISIDVVEHVGAAATRAAGNAWLTRQETLGVLPCIGKMRGDDGRLNIKVFCRTNYKTDNLRHQIIGTYARLLYPAFECEREPRDKACFCDLTFKNGDHTYQVEIECGTHKQQTFKARGKRHKCDRDILFIVAPRIGDPETRMKQVMEWSEELKDRAFFTTLNRLQTHGPHAFVWDYIGRENGPLRRVKLPVLGAVQKYTQNTGETAVNTGENEVANDGD